METLGYSQRSGVREGIGEGLVVGCEDPGNMATGEAHRERAPVRTPWERDWPCLVVIACSVCMQSWSQGKGRPSLP